MMFCSGYKGKQGHQLGCYYSGSGAETNQVGEVGMEAASGERVNETC